LHLARPALFLLISVDTHSSKESLGRVLDASALRRFSEALEAFYLAPNATELAQAVFSAVGELIPDTYMSFDRLDLRTQTVTSMTNCQWVLSPEIESRLVELMPVHPLMPWFVAGGRGAIQITDFISKRQFLDTPLYNDVLKPYSIKRQFLLALDVPGEASGVTINRCDNRGFTKQELFIGGLLAPHLSIALRKLLKAAVLLQAASGAAAAPSELEKLGWALTPRECEVLYWMIQGKRNQEIGTILGSSPQTVSKQVQVILRKGGAETRTAVSFAAQEAVQHQRQQSEEINRAR
jgi:DNA-binding CsgD family transcriptional regulator